jgi:hypothetical protein
MLQVSVMVHLEDARGDIVQVFLYNQIPGGKPAAVRLLAFMLEPHSYPQKPNCCD